MINLYKDHPLLREALWELSDPIAMGNVLQPEESINKVLANAGVKHTIWEIINEEYSHDLWEIHGNVLSMACNHLGHVWGNHKMFRNVAQEASQCPLCAKMYVSLHGKQMDTSKWGGGPNTLVCPECKMNFWTCSECDEEGIGERNARWVDNEPMCFGCFDHFLHEGDIVTCDICGIWTQEAIKIEDGRGRLHTICNECNEDETRVLYCDDCGRKMYDHFDQVRFDENYVYCKDCYGPRAIVAEYDHFEPDPPVLQTSSERRRHDTLLFGLEFELEMDWVKYNQNHWSELTIGKKMAECTPKDVEWGYVKHDGSMKHGVEFVTHPMTEQFYVKNRKTFNEIFAAWRKAGFRTDQWDDDAEPEPRYNCSLHIHMSKAAFGSAHLYKFVKFFYKTHMRKLVQAISQRDANKFAQFERADFRATAQLAKDKENVSGKRFSVINLIGGHWHKNHNEKSPTVEFRLFNGSTDQDIIHKNIEFMLSVFRFTRDNSITHITQKNYFKYLSANRNRYRNLINFLTDKLGKEI